MISYSILVTGKADKDEQLITCTLQKHSVKYML